MALIKDRKSLERVAGEMAMSRGDSFYERGRVKTVARQDNLLEGIVQDSDPTPVHVTIRIKGVNDFKLAQCTCPFTIGAMCKHSVAVLLHWIHYVDITENIDYSKLIFLDEKQLRANALIKALPKKIVLDEVVAKKPKKSNYLLPEYQFRSLQRPKIQIVLSTAGFISGALKRIPFKLVVIHGQNHFTINNLKNLIDSRASRRENFPQFSDFSTRQQYVLNFINELIGGDGPVNQPQKFQIKRMQWALCVGVIANCDGMEFIDGRLNKIIHVKPADQINLSVHIRLLEAGQWGIKASLKDIQNPTRDLTQAHIQEGHPVWVFDAEALTFQPMHENITNSFLNDFLNTERILDYEQMPYFISFVLNAIKSYCEIVEENDCLKDLQFKKPTLRCRLDLDYVKNSLKADLSFVYDNQYSYVYQGKESLNHFAFVANEEGVNWVVRDTDAENAQVDYLLNQCNLGWARNSKKFTLAKVDEIFNFVQIKLSVLRHTMDVYCSAEFEDKLLNGMDFEPLVKVSGSGIDWFEFDAVYKVKGSNDVISHERFKKLIQDGQQFIQLKTGRVVEIPREIYNKIESMSENFQEKKIHLGQLPFVIEGLNRLGLSSHLDAKIAAIYEELKNFKSIEATSVPDSLKGVLRDYQQKGVDWLSFLRKFQFGGVLADEMGLGKTLQALTIIQKEIEQGKKVPHLVVCPTTLVWNWQEEIKKFLPDLKVLVLYGKNRRDFFDDIGKAQIVITSYPLLRRDIELYKTKVFNYVILDEAQNIKNRSTQNAVVAKLLKSSMRLAITGTPIENSLMDLWSIFEFLMPGFFGSAERFKRRYETPIIKFQDKEQLKNLSNRIQPFVLRRLKIDVMKDLPPKIEQISYCELEPTQAKIYTQMAEKAREVASKSVREKGFENSRMLILTLILRLRQICCHPIIAGVDLKHRSVSGKMELLKETIDELLASGHKVLIFSQFVQMLHLIEDHLKHEKISYAYMDGSSRDRQDEVNRFNNDPSLRVFLLSLKVGGVGLNLTSADTVIIYEPWWNPAVENQAIDRVHRIGQTNSVLAYRLITKGTIEEKMVQLQNRKRFLTESLILSEEGIGKKLDWDDIKFLLDF